MLGRFGKFESDSPIKKKNDLLNKAINHRNQECETDEEESPEQL
jgi:hypothetical protein